MGLSCLRLCPELSSFFSQAFSALGVEKQAKTSVFQGTSWVQEENGVCEELLWACATSETSCVTTAPAEVPPNSSRLASLYQLEVKNKCN